jgi:Asp-tRNA(Asn)/Glu-tRNA(Gln) amidotransferase A subunit family amidase
VKDVQGKAIHPIDILRAYGKAAILAHKKTNCLTEIMIAEAESWLDTDCNLKGSLAGIPVSIKDTLNVAGFDSTIGYSSKVGKPFKEDGGIVRLLKDAGAVPYVKTNIPITLLSFESTNDLWGRCSNPHNPAYSPGGSTGGEAALLALGGSRVGIGSDVAGSVRAPAHFSGIYSIKCSTGRFPKSGTTTSMPGQEGIPAVISPMARTMNDLFYFTKSVIKMKPWKYDHATHPIEWREDEAQAVLEQKTLRVGVLRDDGVVTPSPACARALELAVSALKAEGHTVIDVSPPSPFEALVLASRLLNNDGCKVYRTFFRSGEWEDEGARQMTFWSWLPSPARYVYYLFVKYVKRDPIWAELLRGFHQQSTPDLWKLTAGREGYKARWHDWWEQSPKLDFLLTVPNATPAVPQDGMKQAVSSCGYTFMFNLVGIALIWYVKFANFS